MKIKNVLLIGLLILGNQWLFAQDNTLSKKEIQQGWKLLFNGKNLDGWTSVGKDTPPASGWKIEDGVLSTDPNVGHGGDIISREEFTNFELLVDFKLTEGGNSGIKYFFTKYNQGGWLGLEYQILDNINHPDAKMGINGNRLQGTLYDMLPAQYQRPNRVGKWNQARIVAKGSTVTHFLNGKKVLSFDRTSEAYKQAWQRSKFKNTNPPFGQVEKGHILLQEHGDEIAFKNIKIKRL